MGYVKLTLFYPKSQRPSKGWTTQLNTKNLIIWTTTVSKVQRSLQHYSMGLGTFISFFSFPLVSAFPSSPVSTDLSQCHPIALPQGPQAASGAHRAVHLHSDSILDLKWHNEGQFPHLHPQHSTSTAAGSGDESVLLSSGCSSSSVTGMRTSSSVVSGDASDSLWRWQCRELWGEMHPRGKVGDPCSVVLLVLGSCVIRRAEL